MKNEIAKEWFKIILTFFLIPVILRCYQFLENINRYTIIWIVILCWISFVFFKQKVNQIFLTNLLKRFYMGWVIIFFACIVVYEITETSFFLHESEHYPFRPQYVGYYEFIDTGEDENGNTVGKKIPKSLYEINFTKDHNNQYENGTYEKEDFIFWQTGVSRGYDAKEIKYYNKGTSFPTQIENYLTIGLMSFLEIVLMSLKYFFISIFIFIFFSIINKIYLREKIRGFYIPITIDKNKEG